jgi:hypothetical protein
MSRTRAKQLCLGPCLVVLGGWLLAGCIANPLARVNEEKLQDTLRLYEGTVRWGSPERLYGFLRPEDRQHAEIPAGLDNVRVMNYEAAFAPVPIGENRFQNTGVIQYVLQDQQVVKTLTDQQIWEFDAESKNWYRVNPIPPFK